MAAYLPQGFSEALEMVYFPLPQELDGIAHIGIADQPQQVIIGGSCLLLGAHILEKIGDGITLGLEHCCAEGLAACRLRPKACGMVHVVVGKALRLNLVGGKPAQQLAHNGGDDLHMGKFLGADVCEGRGDFAVGHRVALGEIAQGCADLAVRTAELFVVIKAVIKKWMWEFFPYPLI